MPAMRRALLALLLLSLLPALAHAQCNGCYLFEPFNGTTTSPDWFTDNFGPLQWPSDGMGAQAVRLFDCASPSPSSLCTTSTSSTGQEAAISICKNDIQHAGFQPGTGTGTGCIDNGNGMHEETWYRYHIRIAPGYTPTPGTQNAIMEFHVDQKTEADAVSSGGVHAYSTEFNIIADGTTCTGSPIYCTTAGTNPRLFIQIPGGPTSNPSSAARFFPFGSNTLLINHWYDMVLHMVWDADPTIGLAQWWVDGVKVLDKNLSTEYTRSDTTHSYGESMGLYNYRHWANYTSAVDGENFVWGPTNTSIGFAIPSGTTRTAATCNATDIQASVAASSDGDTVLVPASTCPGGVTWSGANAVNLTKGVKLNGQGTIVNFGGNGTAAANGVLTLTADTVANAFVTGFTFNGAFTNGNYPIRLVTTLSPLSQTFRFFGNTLNYTGSSAATWIGIEGNGPGLLDSNTFTTNNAGMESIHVQGEPGNQGAWAEDIVPGSLNYIYIENNNFNGPGISSMAYEAFNGARVVFRNNINSNMGVDGHGFGSENGNSTACTFVNTRWMEIYNNQFNATTGSNTPDFITYRGGSGVIFGNTTTGANGGAGDIRLNTDCNAGSYPILNQVGRGLNQNSSPLYIWGNTPGKFPIFISSGNPINATMIQSGRDYFLSTNQPTMVKCESAADVTAGCPVTYTYAPAVYPHPLTGTVVPPIAPNPPTGLTGSVSGSLVNLSWTPSSGSPAPTAYTKYRGTVHNGPYTAINSGLTSTATTDNPANGTYFYVITAFVGGIVSSVTGNGTTATVTCTATCPFPSGTVFAMQGTGVPAYNGTFTSTGQPTGTTFTFASTSTATSSIGGVWQPAAESTRSNEVQVTVGAVLNLSFAPTSLTFASFAVGTSSPTQTVTVTNTSSAGNTVNISGISFTGTNPGDFSQTNNCPSLLMSGLSCTVTAKFTPTAPGARSALLTFVDNAVGSPQTVPVSGTGVAQAPGVSLSPTSLNFQSQTLSTTSVAQSIILTNTGSGALTITSVVASGDFAVTTVPATNCGTTLASLATCSLNVTFTPTATGGRTGAVTVTDNATGSPHVATLTGTGITTKCAMTGNITLSGVMSVCQ